jgi:NAD(P)-dependent dehydrogenase (short-subunit alcohol dehydrogenase family)
MLPPELLRFHGKVAVITGGAQGLGEGFATRFAREGAITVVLDMQRDKCERVAARLRDEFCAQTLAVEANVADDDGMHAVAGRLLNEFGHIDIWVNNAGVYRGTPMELLSMQEWQMMLDVNYTGVFVCTRAIAPVMKAQQRGRIINMSSIAGRTGFKNSLAYCSTKAAVIGLTRASAMDLAPYNVTVNAVCPGTIMTDMVRKVDADICKNEGWLPGTHIEHKSNEIPMRRLGRVEEVAGVVTFLASDDAGFVTGQAIEVDGGELLV